MANEGTVCFIVLLDTKKTYGFVKYLSPYIIIEEDIITLVDFMATILFFSSWRLIKVYDVECRDCLFLCNPWYLKYIMV